MSTKKGEIVGKVIYSAGDGPEQIIPLGPCEIDATSRDATITWLEAGQPAIASLPIDQYTVYLTAGAITLQQ